jgi:hypothetical protein
VAEIEHGRRQDRIVGDIADIDRNRRSRLDRRAQPSGGDQQMADRPGSFVASPGDRSLEFGEPIAPPSAIRALEHAYQRRSNRYLVIEIVRCVIDGRDDDIHAITGASSILALPFMRFNRVDQEHWKNLSDVRSGGRSG